MKNRTVLIKGVRYVVCTRGELAKMLGKSVITVEKYEVNGVIPPANIRGKDIRKPGGGSLPGRRLYTLELCQKLVVIFKDVKHGVAITGEQKRLIAVAFQEELYKLS